MKPFLKWLGGKTRLLPQLDPLFPTEFARYVEPFVGGGAVFLHLAQKQKFKSAILCDVSEELTVAWKAVQDDPLGLCRALKRLADEYLALPTADREKFYYQMREEHNQKKGSPKKRAARVVFLNKTCYNGLFRHNSKGGFNSPFGRYDKPAFYDVENIGSVSNALRGAMILNGDFTDCERFVNKGTFVYFDPPYRPLSATSSFTSFSGRGFDDADQERLAASFKRLDKRGAKLMLSNSDTPDGYFEGLYAGFNIHRVRAGRSVNSNPELRGKVSELVITNY
jgi:DNA adenine methylase